MCNSYNVFVSVGMWSVSETRFLKVTDLMHSQNIVAVLDVGHQLPLDIKLLLLNIDSFADNTLYRLKIIDKTQHKNTHSTKQTLNYLVDSFREFCVESQLNTQMAFSLLWSKFVSAFLIKCSIAFVCSS